MQYLAMLTMLIDHIGVVFFPDDPLWRIIGRIAFPIYAYGIVMGLAHTRSRKRYATRLAVIGAAAQLPYMAALGVLQINVIGTFLAAIGVLALMERTPSPVLKAAVFLAGVAALELVPFSHGGYALVLIWIYRALAGRPFAMVAAHAALNAVYVLQTGAALQMFSLLPTLVIAFAPRLAAKRLAPRWLWWSFYPAHLAALAAAEAVRTWSGAVALAG